MDMTIRAMTPAERNYCYLQSQQISMQTGLIGHLRADMDSNGKGFFSTFFDFRADLKTEDFKTEFDEVINALRFDENYGGVLKDRSALAAYCRRTPESSFGGDGREFGFRADTEQYSYMLRLNPNRGEYNLYCYCYQRKWLDRHLQQAERGIRFINPNYKELFRIPDGDKIRITYADGEKADRTCRYIDDYHVEIGSGWNSLLHICQFAEMMEQNGSTVIPLRSSLPEQCYSVLPDTGCLSSSRKVNPGITGRILTWAARRKTGRWQMNIMSSWASAKRRNRPCLLVLCSAGQFPLLTRRITMKAASLSARNTKTGVTHDEAGGKAHHLEQL